MESRRPRLWPWVALSGLALATALASLFTSGEEDAPTPHGSAIAPRGGGGEVRRAQVEPLTAPPARPAESGSSAAPIVPTPGGENADPASEETAAAGTPHVRVTAVVTSKEEEEDRQVRAALDTALGLIERELARASSGADGGAP